MTARRRRHAVTLRYNLLDEPLIRARPVAGGQSRHYSLPGLFVALSVDRIRDFPALRPHQRHPWHAFLVQLAAMALHRAGTDAPFQTEAEWKEALLALTPDDPDGAAWCLVTPYDRPAFMQAPVPGGSVDKWKNTLHTPDELDMLVTSKNHDLKAARMRHAQVDDWIMALISLQTQEGVLGAPSAGWFGISRMNKGFGSRVGLGVVPKGHWGRRWRRDVETLLAHRAAIAEQQGLRVQEGIGLLWLEPWSGNESLAFSSLDPFYIEICRRVRLAWEETRQTLIAHTTGSKTARIAAKERNGVTGDPWIPVDSAKGKALTISAKGFNYELMAELLFGSTYLHPPAQVPQETDGREGLAILARSVTRGQGKTEGYHERRVPISPKVRKLLLQGHTDRLAKVAGQHIDAIARIRDVLWTALATLFNQGDEQERFSDNAKKMADRFSKVFEQAEDARFFDVLNEEIESDDPDRVRLQWLISMAERAEQILRDAFTAGPQSAERRYRARAAALSRLHIGLRSDKTLPELADHFRRRRADKEQPHGYA